jgi:serine/threonine protein kinase
MIGKIIGNYQITGELAHGGMGAIYRGHHLRLPREVVVKSILLDSFSPAAQAQLKARFRREACVQSQLDHHNIVRVYEFFEDEVNYYLVMEYVSGMSLRNLLDQQGVPTPSQTVYLFKQVLSALDYAHNFSYVDELNNTHTGIIHRDINPSNLLLDQGGRIKITDFGAVKVRGDSGLTQSGFHPGTLEYMSPEQLRGWEIDARSDIYSAGITFYEMLTGQVPFPRPASGSDWEVRKGHIEQDPPSILKVRPDVPPQLAVIVIRALQKEPEARYQSASEFLTALHNYEQRSGNRQKAPSRSGKLIQSFAATQTAVVPDTIIFPEESPADDFPFEHAITIPLPPPAQSPLPITSPVKPPASNPLNAARTIEGIASVTKPMLTGRGWALTAAISGLLLAGAVFGVYRFSQPEAEGDVQAVMTKVEPAPATITLDKAEVLVRQELYDEAIAAYESYLRRNPDVDSADKVAAKIAEIRKFQGLIETARVATGENNLAVARQSYAEALQLNPASNIAKTGLAEAERKLAVPH